MTPVDPDAVEHIPTEAASTYTKLAEAYGQAYYRSVADVVVPRLQLEERLLDAGTGPGFLPLLLAERVNTLRIHAFDFTRDLVAYGRREAMRRDVDDRVSFFTADCYAIPVRDRSYPVLTCTGVLHSLDDPVGVLDEFHRVLEVGGTAFVFDPTVLDPPDELDIELTDHERDVFERYGVQRTGDRPPISGTEAERLVTDSSFEDADTGTNESGETRLYLTRRE